MKYSLLVLLAFSVGTYAGGPLFEQGQAQGQAQGQQQGQAQGQAQGQISKNRNSNRNSSRSNSRSKSRSSAYAENESSSNAESNQQAVTGDQNIDIKGDVYNQASSRAAMAIGGECFDGASGQNMKGGAALSRANPVCEQLMIYRAYKAAGNAEKASEALDNAEASADIRAFFRGFLTIATLGIL